MRSDSDLPYQRLADSGELANIRRYLARRPFCRMVRDAIRAAESRMRLDNALGDTAEAYRARRRAQGSFLDARTLTFVLTNESYTLEKACPALIFMAKARKQVKII